MEKKNFINELLTGKTVIGTKEQIGDNLYLVPIYKVKVSFFNLKADIKNANNDGSSGNINITPICLLKVKDNDIDIINLIEQKKDNIIDMLPNLLGSIDINSIIKNFS